MKYLKRGKEYDFVDSDDLELTDDLPAGTYQLKCAEFRGFYLERTANFEVTERLYGEANSIADMIYTGFNKRDRSTGALLHGYKGTGKTSIVRLICEQAVADGKAVIVVNECFEGSEFNTVINRLPNSIFVFDEFEKVYRQREQENLLTVFDGTTNSKCLFLLTANNYAGINNFLINRPGRILYSIEFGGLDDAVIEEYLEVNLEDAALKESVRKVFSVFSGTTFDMLKGVVDEVNRTGRPATELLPYLNIDVTGDEYTNYKIQAERKGKLMQMSSDQLNGNPLGRKSINVYFTDPTTRGDDEDENGKWVDFYLDMTNFTGMKGEVVHFTKDGYDIYFEPIRISKFNYDAV